ncbi:MAG: ABC transporter ATP-binding protein [Planctomycetes bacterium]|nr:ABC transporter ATP-binding protein [Planctomycetota bacterium]
MNKPHILRWLSYVLRHKRLLAPAFLAIFFGMAVDVTLPKVIGFIIDGMLTEPNIRAASVRMPFAGDMDIHWAFIAVMGVLLGLLLIRSFAGFTRYYMLAKIGEHVHVDIRGSLFAHLQRLPISYFDHSYTGRIMARLTTDTDAMWHLLNDGISSVIVPSITVIVVLIILLCLNVWLTLLSLLCVPVIALVYARMRGRAQNSTRAQREAVASLYTRLQERISGIRLIRIFGRGQDETRSFNDELQGLFNRNMELCGTFASLGAKSHFLTGSTTSIILCLGGIAAAMGKLTIGELIQFYLYSGMLFSPIDQITRASASVFTTAKIAMERIFELLDASEAVELKGPNTPCPRLTGRVEFRGVNFGYRPEKPVLKDVSFDVAAGRTVALVGPSGAGKTTIVNLLCRFYNPTGGEILIDGLPLNQFEVESFRRQISYVTQEDFLFSGTIADNIGYALPQADIQEIERAARQANAHDFISQLPHGLQTPVGERGVTLSGGQKQRINIARALLRDPAILILDEPTSALDAESESILLEALTTVFRDRTVFIIAHRLSTVMSADTIMVLDGGKIAQQGGHAALMSQEGLYAELCKKQFLGFGGSQKNGTAGKAG